MKAIKEFNTQKWGFGSNFVNFFQFYGDLNQGEELIVYTYLNPIQENYNILDIFELSKENIKFNSSKFIYTYSFKNAVKNLIVRDLSLKDLIDVYILKKYHNSQFKYPTGNAYSILSNPRLRGIAKLKKETLDKLKLFDTNKFYNKIFDVGIHLRFGDKISEIKANSKNFIPEEQQRELLESFLNNSETDNIYIASDNLEKAIKLIKSICTSKSVTIYHQLNLNKSGHDQLFFNQQSTEQKEKQFYEFLLDCYLLSNCKTFLGSVNSNVTYFVGMLNSRTKIFTYDGKVSYL